MRARRDHFIQSAELKFNCFFLMPVINEFPTTLRADMEQARVISPTGHRISLTGHTILLTGHRTSLTGRRIVPTVVGRGGANNRRS